MLSTSVLTGIGGLILAAGLVDDFATKKFHNWLFLLTFTIGMIAALVLLGIGHFPQMILSVLAAIVVYLPLVLLRAMGAGDMKILMAFATTSVWSSVLEVAIFSAIWGLIFGLVKITLDGHLKSFGKNLWLMALGVKPQELTLHKIPFAAAIFLGWLSHLVFKQGLL